MPLSGRLEELDQEECLALLATVPVGRVGISSQALPAILPVNFVLHDGSILFRTVPGTKLHAAVAGAVVAFEADHVGTAPEPSWSVLVRGQAEPVTDPAERDRVDTLVPATWAFERDARHVVRIPITLISGRRVRRAT
ncbi:MAG: pyridoxamine 5'-phosphate oxidase family protein [Acidimicrobiaceae bacterium]|nr:pyridoxamine 5'-phosphate oxidase family protein [Acidimicrobiaceae bacterium]